MSLLFYRGHVFTSQYRFKSYEKIENVWNWGKWWYYIQVGNDAECKMVLQTSMSRVTDLRIIEADDFLGVNYK
jgi:hypothetical protein